MGTEEEDNDDSSSESSSNIVFTEERWFDRYRWVINFSALAAYILGGVLMVKWLEQWDVLTSVYVITQIVTTIGYGDITVKKASSQWFMIFYVMTGTMVIANILNAYLERTFSVAVEAMKARLRSLEAYQMESVKDTKAAKERCGPLNGLMVALVNYLFFLFVGTFFYACEESCSCSYGLTLAEGCVQDNCVATGGYTKNFREALYMSVITLSTTGFGDFSPESKVGRFLGVFWMVGGVVSWVNLVTQALFWWHEMKQAARVRNLVVRPDLFEDIDHNGDGHLTRAEFRLYYLMKSGIVKDEDILEIDSFFDVLDLDKSGRLHRTELDAAMKLKKHTYSFRPHGRHGAPQ